jgi:UDP-glucose 4-epimerase
MNILLTGGTGYIGSHTAVALLAAGHQVVLFDNLSNSQASVVDALETITGQRIPFVEGDIRNTAFMAQTLSNCRIDAVIHFAGLKAVGESVATPLAYYDNNVGGTIGLLQAMQKTGIKTLVFSSSATVYGVPQYLPIDEAHPTGATNPYGRTKLHIEHMLAEMAQADASWRIAALRYFNPAGAHDSGLIGENPNGIPNNLMPYIVRVALGTGVRDYIHVMDLAEGHVAALEILQKTQLAFDTFNLGTGQGYSVVDMVKAYEAANGVQVPYRVAPRRPGDVAACFAKVDKAQAVLRWSARRSLQKMCHSAHRT